MQGLGLSVCKWPRAGANISFHGYRRSPPSRDAMEDISVGDRKLKLRVSRRYHDVLVSIEDSGKGIPDDKLESIFQPFVTTKQQGTGLGLSIARTIVGTHGGKIWAENGPRGGAIFHFTLDLVRSEAA